MVADAASGRNRCCRCFRLGHGADAEQPCLSGGGRRHTMCRLGGGMFCSTCGAYSFAGTRRLASACKGPPAAKSSAAKTLGRLLAGNHPAGQRRHIGEVIEIYDEFLPVDL